MTANRLPWIQGERGLKCLSHPPELVVTDRFWEMGSHCHQCAPTTEPIVSKNKINACVYEKGDL